MIADPNQRVMPYVVVTRANQGQTMKTERIISSNGGTVVSSYPQVGVVVAYSAADDFSARLRQDKTIEAVGATRTAKIPAGFFAQRAKAEFTGAPYPRSNEVPAEGQGWDTLAIDVAKAHEVTTGSKDVTVGILDTGVDDTHPEIQHAVDTSQSVTCVAGWADQTYGAWRNTRDGHGTHLAGTIAAARDGKGTVGIAPDVRIAAVKMADGDDEETPESEVCGYIWAAEHGFRIVNNSYRTYPWRFSCPSDPDQAAILKAVSRAAAYAQSRNVLFVASAGNAGTDWDTRTQDVDSPADTTPVKRTIDTTCLRLPHQLPGVIGASALDQNLRKATFSNFGFGSVGLGAPGANTWSTWPNGQYRPASGTSMASPQVAGVAALVASRFPELSADQIRERLYATATPAPCPVNYPVTAGICKAEGVRTNFYGAGFVNAAAAVGATP
ncbi:S8 family peptidase [Streptosporangium sp. NPDC087985]|uniref:S8 family peptidase n=1 Tax=Streptosporangium sp. NPDC087985 TaxID=3366196 RepID=UPI00380FCB7A